MPPLLLWLLVSWLAGWCLLPTARLLFTRLPDGGLAPARVLWLLLSSLLALWTAVYGLAPLSFAPLWVLGVPLLGLLPLANAARREEFFGWLREHKAATRWSDAVFVGSFLAFAWVRARHPEINDLEKPMDAALLASAARADWLPFQNCWFAGHAFTDYYYFFPLCGALLLRTFDTPVSVGYNLVQPLVCALFWSTLWSLGAGLAGTLKRGLAVMLVVALFGHFEPIRQWLRPYEPARDELLFRLNWWQTSRVIGAANPNVPGDQDKTINEYPAFTTAVGDVHAHFFALPFAVALFCLCRELVGAPLSSDARVLTRRRVALVLCGLLLSAFWAGNTWDVPIYALLVLTCAAWPLVRGRVSHVEEAPVEEPTPTKRERRRRERAGEVAPVVAPQPIMTETPLPPRFKIAEGAWILGALLLARIGAQPYLRTFDAPISGVQLSPWLPPLLEVAMLWGGIFALLGFAFLFWRGRREAVLRSSDGAFALCLAACGLVAWTIPFLVYIRGAFGDGPYRHMDTVFKFGLQAWLLLGIAGAASAARCLSFAPRHAPKLVGAWAVASVVPLMCGLAVFWTRAFHSAPKDAEGRVALSLNGAKFLPNEDQRAVEWLRRNASRETVLLEACDPNGSGDFQGDFARVSALSGVPTVYGWGGHITAWGADGGEAEARRQKVLRVYAWPSDAEAFSLLRELNATHVFVGATERRVYDPKALSRLERALPDKVFARGQTFIARVPK